MKKLTPYATIILALAPGALFAQKWEVGGSAGYGFYRNGSVTSPAGDGSVGFKSGPSFGFVLGNNMYNKVSGELRYSYRMNDMFVKSGGTEALFNGESHILHYDFLIHARDVESPIRPFAAVGGGIKVYRGTGAEVASQALNRLALLTKTMEPQGMLSVGGGVKVQISQSWAVRAEFRDYITPFPKKVIAPSINAKISGWLHDFVPMVTVTYTR